MYYYLLPVANREAVDHTGIVLKNVPIIHKITNQYTQRNEN